MFSTPQRVSVTSPADKSDFVHIACGTDSSMKPGPIETYSQSTGPTTTTTLLHL